MLPPLLSAATATRDAASWRADGVWQEGFTLKELKDVFAINELRRNNIVAKDLLKIGVKVSELREGGFKVCAP